MRILLQVLGAAAGTLLCCLPAHGEEPDDAPLVETYKLNYIILYSEDRTIDADDPARNRERDEAKFQLSLKKRLLTDIPLYLGFTQRVQWQVFDEAGSRPFREFNMNPEIFLNTPNGPLLAAAVRFGFQTGIEHESNGRGIEVIDGEEVNRSRSWDRIYVWPRITLRPERPIIVSLKAWLRLPEDAKTDPLDPSGDDNPDIERYLGHAELRLWLQLGGGAQLLYMFRKGRLDRAGTSQLDWLFRIPFVSRNIFAHVQYFYGFGESLVDYNRPVNRLGIGLAFGDPLTHYLSPIESMARDPN